MDKRICFKEFCSENDSIANEFNRNRPLQNSNLGKFFKRWILVSNIFSTHKFSFACQKCFSDAVILKKMFSEKATCTQKF